MLFELINTPVSFQKYINKIFAKLLNIFIIVYLDNIFINIHDDGNDYIAAVRWVLEQPRKFLLYANLKKSWFHEEEVWFLGYVVFLKDICIEDQRVKAIK